MGPETGFPRPREMDLAPKGIRNNGNKTAPALLPGLSAIDREGVA